MPLQSEQFRGDPKLEAAAVSDSAHILTGARGDHVRKIQFALIKLDGAVIQADGIYGAATAAAVSAYKQKRNIINHSCQDRVDDIVGRMTMAALDAEMFNVEALNSRWPRIVAVRPRADLSPRTPVKADVGTIGFSSSKRGAKSLFDKPQIIFPPRPFHHMELLPNQVGNFQVIDGIGSLVKCEDETVGFVFEPAEPFAHGGTMRVAKTPHQFSVRARSIGTTWISVRKPGSSLPFPSDSLALDVVAQSERLTWNPKWSVQVTSMMSADAWMSEHVFHGEKVLAVRLKSGWVEFKGEVDPDSSIKREDYEVGILQNLMASEMTAYYVDANDEIVWRYVIATSPTPIRDAADRPPPPNWYANSAVKPLNSTIGTRVEASDAPTNIVPWQTKDKMATLKLTRGTDQFRTWLAVREKRTGTFTILCWALWAVDWGCEFDPKNYDRRTLTGATRINSQDDDGPGSVAPITAGKVAIEATTATWKRGRF
jgi:hypothetical protein